MTTREALIHLVAELPDEALPEAERLLDGLRRQCNGKAVVPKGTAPASPQPYSSLLLLIENATDLGREVSSEDPHGFAGRDKRWFELE